MTDGSLAPQDLTQLLVRWRNGDRSALDEMTPVLYEELRRLARHFLAAERSDHTLQPTALVHEAYLRLVISKWWIGATAPIFSPWPLP